MNKVKQLLECPAVVADMTGGYDNTPMPRIKSRERNRGMIIRCYKCGATHTTLHKVGNDYLCRDCLKKTKG